MKMLAYTSTRLSVLLLTLFSVARLSAQTISFDQPPGTTSWTEGGITITCDTSTSSWIPIGTDTTNPYMGTGHLYHAGAGGTLFISVTRSILQVTG